MTVTPLIRVSVHTFRRPKVPRRSPPHKRTLRPSIERFVVPASPFEGPSPSGTDKKPRSTARRASTTPLARRRKRSPRRSRERSSSSSDPVNRQLGPPLSTTQTRRSGHKTKAATLPRSPPSRHCTSSVEGPLSESYGDDKSGPGRRPGEP